jgi:hypothetical protein
MLYFTFIYRLLGSVCDCDFVGKNAILKQITENESFGNCVFKKLRFEKHRKVHIQIAGNVVLFLKCSILKG